MCFSNDEQKYYFLKEEYIIVDNLIMANQSYRNYYS